MPKNEVTDHAYIQEHQPAAHQELGEQSTAEHRHACPGLPWVNVTRDQILTRLWEIANLSPEITRGSLAGQVKALSMIVAIEGLIPDRRAASARNQPASPPVTADIYKSAWLRAQQTGENKGKRRSTPDPFSGENRRRAFNRPRGPRWPATHCRTHARTLIGAPCANGRPLRSRHQGSFLHQKEPLRPAPLSFRKAKRPKNIGFYRIL